MRQNRPAHALAILLALAPGLGLADQAATGQAATAPPHGMHGRHHAPPAAEEMTRRMQEELGLSEEQTAKVRLINEQHVTRMKQLRPSEEEMRARAEQRDRIRSEHDAALKAVLDTRQYETLRKSRATHEKRMRARRGVEHPR
jgi:Spy/CpxP family protein refolding chaperone